MFVFLCPLLITVSVTVPSNLCQDYYCPCRQYGINAQGGREREGRREGGREGGRERKGEGGEGEGDLSTKIVTIKEHCYKIVLRYQSV